MLVMLRHLLHSRSAKLSSTSDEGLLMGLNHAVKRVADVLGCKSQKEVRQGTMSGRCTSTHRHSARGGLTSTLRYEMRTGSVD